MKKISIKLGNDFKKFLQNIKPKSSKNLKKKNISIIGDILFGLIKGQECFLNTIVKNTEKYNESLESFKQNKSYKQLGKIAQIAKLSEYLNTNLYKFKIKFIKNIFQNLELKSFDELKNKSLKERVFEQGLILHDTTDIQKPFAKKMEKVAQTRDGSSHKKIKTENDIMQNEQFYFGNEE